LSTSHSTMNLPLAILLTVICKTLLLPLSREIFAPVRKLPLIKGAIFYACRAWKTRPRRFIHDHRLWEYCSSIVWPWEICPYDGDLLNRGNFFTLWIRLFCHEKITNVNFLFILGTLIANFIFISSPNIKLLIYSKSIL